jgi:hypothetical protein
MHTVYAHLPANIEKANESLQGPLSEERFDVALHWAIFSLHFQGADIPWMPSC